MIARVLSKFSSESGENRYVNHNEIYQDHYRRIHIYGLQKGYLWEHDDVFTLTSQYCGENAERLIKEGAEYNESINLIHGPRTFLLDRIYAELVMGEKFQVKLIIFDQKQSCNAGCLNLQPYVELNNENTGIGKLIFENDNKLPLGWMKIGRHNVVKLFVSGSIRVTSSIDFILQVEDE
ncbi:MAG: hypothetical protein ACI936_001151 [Paraglaciecola sp.]|jgi:hypothetical protein